MLVRLRKAKSSCNLLEASFREIPAELPLKEAEERFRGFSDLTVSWDHYGPDGGRGAKLECQKLIEGLRCPRCKKTGNLTIELWEPVLGGFVVIDARPPRYHV